MARVKVINTGQNQDLIGGNFTNDASKTIFNLGQFSVESNFTGRKTRDYSNELSSFVKPITLETLGLNTVDSTNIFEKTELVELNLDNSDLKSYIKYGSSKEFVRITVENIIVNYPSSLFVSSQVNSGGNITVTNFVFDELSNISSFNVPTAYVIDNFEMVFNDGNSSVIDDNELKNLNISFKKYVIWKKTNPEDNTHKILEFTGDTNSNANIRLKVQGNPFPEFSGATSGNTNYHLKPEPLQYNKFIAVMSTMEQYFLSNRLTDQSGFAFEFKDPTLLENGEIIYTPTNPVWNTSDGYNIDISGSKYSTFFDSILNIGDKYDEVKTDLVARFLTPSALKVYDTTDEGKITKLLRIYGAEFDKLKQFIDSLVNINKTTYDKKNNIPDTLVKNLAKTLGWDVFSLVTEKDLVESFFATDREFYEDDLLPAEIDIELWRRIIINTTYFWKTKGTRDAIKSIFLLIGIPEPFINISEYIYTVDGKINPNNVELSLEDLPSASLPYNNSGYPIAPVETNDFYFQIDGNNDSGQAYINNFRNVGFVLNRRNDNKKSWSYAGEVERVHYSTPNYYQNASELIINTKEVDATLDLARAIEYDVYLYNKDVDDPLTSTGFTSPYIFINVAFDYGFDTGIFTIPDIPLTGSSIQLSFNGITLTSGGTGVGDYTRTGNKEVTLNDGIQAKYSNNDKDLITLTYLYDRLGGTGYTQVQYLVQAPVIGIGGTTLTLPEEPKGDVQLIIDGITMTKSTSLFTGDFIINPANPAEIIVQNSSLQTYLQSNPIVRMWYIVDDGVTSNAKVQSEAYRVDTLNGAKLYYNSGIDKYIYVMDVAAFDIDSVKITTNGITLQNNKDFTLNPANKKQIYITNHPIRFGDIIGAYYIVDDTNYIPPLLPADDTFPNIQDMSFLEYLELIQRRLINVKTRKTISDFNGGYYPTVMNIYDNYLKRSRLDDNDPLQSNGYTFNNLYPFINQYNAFFNRFVNELLPATIILRKGGILIRNTSFNQQKFMYKRGVYFNESLQWLGMDGAEYIRPLPVRSCSWTSDSICVNDINPCIGFEMTNIFGVEDEIIIPPTTPPPVQTNAVIVAVGGDSNGTEIYKSTDAGISWTKSTTVGGFEANDVEFFNSTDGIAVGGQGTVHRTTDGGSNWLLIGNPLGTKIHVDADNTFNTATAIFDETNMVIGGLGEEYFKSNDNGATWSKVPSVGGLDQLAKAMYMFTSDSSLSVSLLGTARILKSIQAHSQWADVDGGIGSNEPSVDRSLTSVGFAVGDNTVGLAAGVNGAILKTTDTGSNWVDRTGTMAELAPNGKSLYVTDIVFTTSTNVYMLGLRDTVEGTELGEIALYKSTDAGESWTDYTSIIGITTSPNQVTMAWVDDLRGWIAISDGRILRTVNGGLTWAESIVPALNGSIFNITAGDLETAFPPITTEPPTPTTAAPTFEFKYIQDTPANAQSNEWRYTWTNTNAPIPNWISVLDGDITKTGFIETYNAASITVLVEKVNPITDVDGDTTITWSLNGTSKQELNLIEETGTGTYTFTNLSADDLILIEVYETTGV